MRGAVAQLRSQHAAGLGRRRLLDELLDAATPRCSWPAASESIPDFLPSWIDLDRIGRRDAELALPRRRWAAAQLPFFGADPVGEADVYSHALYGSARAGRGRRGRLGVLPQLAGRSEVPDYRMKGFTRRALRGDVPDEISTAATRRTWTAGSKKVDYPAVRDWVGKGDFGSAESTT